MNSLSRCLLLLALLCSHVGWGIGVWAGFDPDDLNFEGPSVNESALDTEVVKLIAEHRKAMLVGVSSEEVQAIQLAGRYIDADGESRIVIQKMRPAFLRVVLQSQRVSFTQLFNGREGWNIVTKLGEAPQVIPMGIASSEATRLSASIFNYLIESDQKGRIEYQMLSDDSSGNKGIEVTVNGVNVIHYWLDPDTFLIRREVKSDHNDAEFEFKTVLYDDYRVVDGLQIPYVIQHLGKNVVEYELHIDRVEVVDSFPESMFSPLGEY
ncbi:hypothetical protein [Cerasicoccus maritimus]|uniref:hypothetical protein n=1 Tax=Cerasicoccus maritimus TaxID=490089 RepID=UPI002852512A|nr:hypothetical protein [Cerasicoccus maritimus]